EAARDTDPASQAERYRRLGQITAQKLYRAAESRGYYEEVLQRLPEDREALEALEQIFNQGQSYPELLSIYKKKEAATRDPARRLELLFKVAVIEEDQLSLPEDAIATYRRALEVAEKDHDGGRVAEIRALKALEKLYAGRDDAQGLVGVLERQL